MTRLKRLIIEAHRRSLWQVLIIYLGASWAVLEAVDHVVERYFLPEWVSGAAVILLLIGFPIVMATAFVREEPWQTSGASSPEGGGESAFRVRSPEPGGEVEAPGGRPIPEPRSSHRSPLPGPLVWFLTWPKAILGGVLGFMALAAVSAFIVARGMPRVAEASGSAGEAFEERAWIVFADFEAPPDERQTALAAQTALTVDLQQSRYVNVYGRNQIAGVLRRMGLPDTTAIDEEIALEIAEREGLAAVLAASISRLGSDYVLGARVVQPGSGRELIAVRTAAREERLLEGVEALSRELRGRLGEAGEDIRASQPLPRVTTESLEALKSYSEADLAVAKGHSDPALTLAGEAIRLDSTFAMAYRLISVIYLNWGQFADARRYISRAYELRHRLTDRERFHVEGVRHFLDFDPRRAVATYELILSRYPDDHRALTNISYLSYVWLDDYERSYETAYRVAEMFPYSAIGLANVVGAAIMTGRWEVADSLIRAAMANEMEPAARWFGRDLAFARGDWDSADEHCSELLGGVAPDEWVADGYRYCGAIDIARGRLRRGRERMERAAARFSSSEQHLNRLDTAQGLVVIATLYGDRGDVAAPLERLLDDVPSDAIGEPDRFLFRTKLAGLAGLHERPELVEHVLEWYPTYSDSAHWLARYGEGLAGAAHALASGRSGPAIDRIHEAETIGYEPMVWRPLLDLIAGLAFERVGQVDSAVARLGRVIEPRRFEGTTIIPYLHLPHLLRRLGELEERRGNLEAAARHYARLLELWSDADPELRSDIGAVHSALRRVTASEVSEGDESLP